MGVTRRRSEDMRPIRIEDIDHFNYADFDLTESGDEADLPRVENDVDVATSRSRKCKERRAEKKMRRVLDKTDTTDGLRIKNNMGARKWRRVESARMLLSLTDQDDIVTDFSDLVPQAVTAFQKLFIERESMEAWNDFIAKDESEQREILKTGRWTQEETKGWFVVGGKSTPKKGTTSKDHDGRHHHPAYSAKACFERLDRRSKKLLGGKSLPWAFISMLEDDLRCFFSSSGDSGGGVFVGRYDSPVCRALAHAVSQYLMLTCKSVVEGGTAERIMEVRNTRAFFIPPHSQLIPYLSYLRGKPIEFVPWVSGDAEEPVDCGELPSSPNGSPDSSLLCYRYPRRVDSLDILCPSIFLSSLTLHSF